MERRTNDVLAYLIAAQGIADNRSVLDVLQKVYNAPSVGAPVDSAGIGPLVHKCESKHIRRVERDLQEMGAEKEDAGPSTRERAPKRRKKN
jgi:hypothetical protein